MRTTDRMLLQRVRGREADALAEFLENCRLQLLAFIERRLSQAMRRKVEVQDLFQEVAIHALRLLPQTDLSERDPFGWLCMIAEERIVDAHRKFFGAQKRAADREVHLDSPAGSNRQRALIDLLVVSMTSPSQALARNEREARLLEALASLPEESREALRLRYVENLPSKEIARRLGRSDGAVRVMLSRSLDRLQELLGSADS